MATCHHPFTDSLIHWFISSLIPRFIGSLTQSVSCAWFLSCHAIGIWDHLSNICSFVDPSPSFHTSLLLHLKNSLGHFFPIVVSFFRKFFPGVCRALLVLKTNFPPFSPHSKFPTNSTNVYVPAIGDKREHVGAETGLELVDLIPANKKQILNFRGWHHRMIYSAPFQSMDAGYL